MTTEEVLIDVLRAMRAEGKWKTGDRFWIQVRKIDGDKRDALIESLAYRPDVVLTDLRMPVMDGIELTREIRRQLPQTAVVVLTAYDDDDNLFAALKAGAIGYVLKDASVPQIAEAVRAAHAGEGFLSAGLVARVVREFTRIDRMARGQRNREIAKRLFLSEKTVRNHVSAILGKLHANDRTEAALIAARYGLGPRVDDTDAP